MDKGTARMCRPGLGPRLKPATTHPAGKFSHREIEDDSSTLRYPAANLSDLKSGDWVRESTPHYCEKCGKELKFSERVINVRFDKESGQKMIQYQFRWTCPDRESFWWKSGHTNVERNGESVDDALTYQHFNFSDYCMS